VTLLARAIRAARVSESTGKVSVVRRVNGPLDRCLDFVTYAVYPINDSLCVMPEKAVTEFWRDLQPIAMCRDHYEKVGLGAGYVKTLFR
jgi:hypothetical protein